MTDAATARPFNITCIRCGYDLAGLPDDGRCPECTASIAESRRLSLQRAPARFRRGLRIGSLFAALSLPLMGFQFVLLLVKLYRDWASRGMPGPAPLLLRYGPWIAELLVNLLWLVAAWLATAPTPAVDAHAGPRRTRRLLRVLLVTLTVLVAAMWIRPAFAWIPRWIASQSGFTLYHILMPLHLLHLARRTGRRDLEGRARRACILVPVLAIPSTMVWPISTLMDWAPPFTSNTTWWLCQLGLDAMLFAATMLIYLVLRAIAKSIAAAPAVDEPLAYGSVR